ncbi:protein kinase superfamily protein [Actinidia rufa]|uniref:Protein kinase superfamily protein n=1 Tax=Actinidia rufa TaxID=165716 RepID=A0A7J0FMC2_9ERIC|nr:protein kinase superfamily protein [Actinidia rufa]
MEDKKIKIIAAAVIAALIAGIVVARLSLKLSEAFYVIAGAGTAAIIAVFAILLLRHGFDRRRRLMETQMVSEGRELRIEYSFLRKVAGVPTKFRERELEEATDGFTCLVGKGSSACVFKGILSDGTAVAVKRIEGEERGEREFRSEVAAIASVQHVNLVRLLGYCSVPAGNRFLVYEFIPYGSLDKWIFPPRREPQPQPQPKGKLTLGRVFSVGFEVEGVDEREVRKLVHVALWCVQEKARLRPTMAQVVEMLEGRVPVDEPPDTQMIIIDLLSIDKEEEEHNPSRDRQRLAATRVNSDVASSSTYSYSMSVLSGR